ncbi:MAG: HlyD family efflux transporter periplasmic adaptor subunit [Anaeromyxobacter sp.]
MVRRSLAVLAVLAAVAVLALALRPSPVEVETALADRGPLEEVVEGTGRIRVRERYEVAAPVAGVLARVAVHAGDAVSAGQVLARVLAPGASPLDPRARAEAEGRLAAAVAAEAEARAAAGRVAVEAARAERELARAREVAGGGALSSAALDEAEAGARARDAERRMAEAGLRRAAAEVAATRAVLDGGPRGGGPVEVRAPVAGTVLRVLRESGGPVAPGTPLLELGDLAAIEVIVDLPSAEAVRARAGQRARVTGWGGGALAAAVDRVEPGAFTKVSPLGVEEQRVNVVLSPAGPGWEALGDGYAADVSVIVRRHEAAVRVPGSALFRTGAGDALFVVDGGRARLVPVDVAGRGGGLAALGRGLEPGARVVVHPGDRVSDRVRVAVR